MTGSRPKAEEWLGKYVRMNKCVDKKMGINQVKMIIGRVAHQPAEEVGPGEVVCRVPHPPHRAARHLHKAPRNLGGKQQRIPDVDADY